MNQELNTDKTTEEKTTNEEVKDERTLPPIDFNFFNPQIQEAIKAKNWQEPMKVQAHVAPYFLKKIDLIVQSKTGSGKTAAFLLPLIESLLEAEKGCQALILVPTRELAKQVFTEFSELTQNIELSGVPIYGGTSYKPQLDALKNGVQVVIGTPGRVLDHLIRGTLSVKNLKYLIFDEADELLSMGFYKDMAKIGDFLPKKRVSTMFSATMPDSVKRLAERFLRDPFFLGLSKDGIHVSSMDHISYEVDAMEKDRILMRLFELEDPESAIIFCNTKSEVEYLSALLKRFGYDADPISGDLNQKKRESVMARLKAGTLRFLVATDIAARGIDISNLEYVIMYDMHKDFAQYIHRAGRTARAGKRGVAISLVTTLEAVDLRKFAKKEGIELIEREVPSEEQVQARTSEKLVARLESELRDSSTARKERMKRYSQLAKELTEHENGTEILSMLLDGFHQAIIRMGRATPTAEKPSKPQHSSERHGRPQKRRRNNRPRTRRNPA
jgi:ATP-dependent RNA helicase DeaD